MTCNVTNSSDLTNSKTLGAAIRFITIVSLLLMRPVARSWVCYLWTKTCQLQSSQPHIIY